MSEPLKDFTKACIHVGLMDGDRFGHGVSALVKWSQRAAEVLGELEWADCEHAPSQRCFECAEYQEDGHAPDCALKALLVEWEGGEDDLPQCDYIRTQRERYNWICPKCSHTSTTYRIIPMPPFGDLVEHNCTYGEGDPCPECGHGGKCYWCPAPATCKLYGQPTCEACWEKYRKGHRADVAYWYEDPRR